MQSDYVPCLKVYTNKIVNYAKFTGTRFHWSKPPRENKPKHKMSIKSIRNIDKYIDFLVDVSPTKWTYCKKTKKHYKYKLGFLTLTLPSSQLTDYGQQIKSKMCTNPICQNYFTDIPNVLRHSDEQIKNICLNQFLTELRQVYSLKCYIWKAETQANSNIHFHIIIDKFIHWEELRNRWNRCVNKLGYVDRFAEKHDHSNPNSIDIHSIRSIKKLKQYFSKYLTKSDLSRRYVRGRVWSCSSFLSSYDGVTIPLKGLILLEYQKWTKVFKSYVFYSDYFNVWKISWDMIRNNFKNSLIAAEIEKLFLDKYGISVKYGYG